MTRLGGIGPLRVAAVTLFAYLLLFALVLSYHHGDVRGFSLIGHRFLTQSQRSPVIQPSPLANSARDELGYDGQFVYYIALDPVNARFYVDNPPYRYTRILYPLLTRLLALGQPEAVALTLVLVNLLAAVGGAAALAAWCQIRGQSPWLALVYSLNMGQMMAFARGLTEVLAYALVAVAIYAFERAPRHRWLAALLFGLAGLARETTLLFAFLYCLRLMIEYLNVRPRRPGAALAFVTLAGGPTLLWQTWLYWWLGSIGLAHGPGLVWVPLSGLIPLYPFAVPVVLVLMVVLVPTLLCLGGAIYALSPDPRARGREEVWALLLNALFFGLLLAPSGLVDPYGAARIGLGSVLAAVYALAYARRRGWFYGASTIWMLGTFVYLVLLSGITPIRIWP